MRTRSRRGPSSSATSDTGSGRPRRGRSRTPLDRLQRLRYDLVHVEVLIAGEPPDEGHVVQGVGERLVALVEAARLGARDWVVRVALGLWVLHVESGPTVLALPRHVAVLGDARPVDVQARVVD